MSKTPKRSFLFITDEEWETLKSMHKTWAWVMEHFDQPKWCGYPDALAGEMGCWSLVGRMVTSREYCKNCDCLIKQPKHQGVRG
jgi:hypothetical protein